MARGNRRKEKRGQSLLSVLAHPAKTCLTADARSTAGLQSDTTLTPSSRFVWLFGAGHFFRKLESDLTVFEFQMSGKRPSLF